MATACRRQQPDGIEAAPAPAGDDARGEVARIERLAIHDGPGIRTVVFLKGCPLRCSWCSSPETQRSGPELFFDAGRCIRCGACLDACPRGAASRAADGCIHVDRDRCGGCGECVRACAAGARRIVGRSLSVAEVLHEIEKDEVFYYRSGGGVTVSGGEPLAQPGFTSAILRGCADRGIHTAMETSACGPWEGLSPLLEVVDRVYADVKHMDEDAHCRATGRGNRAILDNIRRLARGRRRPALILRVPVIPGCNDSTENMEATAAFALELGCVERVELLPYHRYGLHRYAATGRQYEHASQAAPSEERMRELVERVGSCGVPVRIGG